MSSGRSVSEVLRVVERDLVTCGMVHRVSVLDATSAGLVTRRLLRIPHTSTKGGPE